MTLYRDGEFVRSNQEIIEYLNQNNIEIKPYSHVFSDLEKYEGKIAVDPKTCNHKAYSSVKDGHLIEVDSLIGALKLVKTETELNGYRSSQIRDGAALAKFFAWLENELLNKGSKITEYEASEKLCEFRAQQDLYKGPSFPPILGSGPNGAIIHYRPTEENSAVIDADAMLLCDSGGQYLDGTTDTTRTFHFGRPTTHEVECYTRVLKGNLNLERIKFPAKKKYTIKELDILARTSLFKAGIDYVHGTGHGVGHFLNVHEGPYDQHWKPGMVHTNEPGYYEDGKFGIRIENMLICKKDLEFENFLGFEAITMFPYCKNLMNLKLLARNEIDHINKYHEKVKSKLLPLLKDDALATDYIVRESSPIV
jgi:Xaa-Pro aminopeptidase